MTIERLSPCHAVDYRTLMLEAYAACLEAFTSSVADRERLPLAWWEARLSAEPAAKERVIGAFDGGEVAGVAGLRFEQREKIRQKVTPFGMYVRPHCRAQGVGRRLVLSAIAHARGRSGVTVIQPTVTEGNDAALALYESCGFVRFGVEPLAIGVDSRYLAKVHMWCRIDLDRLA